MLNLKKIKGRVTLQKQRGITLTEVILATSVSMMMLVWAGKMQAQSIEDMRSKNTADQYQSIRTLAVQYFKSNRAALIAAMDTGASAGTWCSANDTTKKVCVVDIPKLIANSAAPAWVKPTNPYNQKIAISYHLVSAATGQTEILVYGATNGTAHMQAKNESASLAAQMLGENGGVIPQSNFGACATTQACGVMGGWVATLNNYVAGAYTPVSGSIASYSVVI